MLLPIRGQPQQGWWQGPSPNLTQNSRNKCSMREEIEVSTFWRPGPGKLAVSPLPNSVGHLGPLSGWDLILSLNGKSSKDLCLSLIYHTLMKSKLCSEAHNVKKRTRGLNTPFGLLICTLFIGVCCYNLSFKGIIIAVWYVRIAEKRQYYIFNGNFLQIMSQLRT